jgi:hypothetical protein
MGDGLTVASENEKQALEVPELANSIIRRHDGLSTFFTGDTDTDVGLLDHSARPSFAAVSVPHRKPLSLTWSKTD